MRGIGVAVIEHVRVQALRSHRRALQHAEAVLLVDDHQAQLAKTDGLLYQRVRPDDHVHRAARQLSLQLAVAFAAVVAPVMIVSRKRDCSRSRRMLM